MDDGKYYYYLKLRNTRCVTLNRPQEYLYKQEIEWFNPLSNEYANEWVDTFKGYKPLISPFGDEFSILRIKHS